MTRSTRVALACAVCGVLVNGVAVAAVVAQAGGRLTVLVRMSYAEPMARVARRIDPTFAFVPPEGHYDGVYFYEEGMDPLALGSTHTLIDHAVYRYGHAGFGMLAWIASGARASALAAALPAINLAAIAAAAALASLLAARYGHSPWWGLFVGLQPGVLFAAIADTSEPVGIAVALAGLYLWLRGRRGAAAGLFAFAVVCKEPFLLVPAGLLLFEIAERVRRREVPHLGGRVGWLLLPFVVFVGWQAWLHGRFGAWPVATGGGNLLTWPFVGWFDGVRYATRLGAGGGLAPQVGTAMLPLMLAFGGALAVGVARSARLRSPFACIFLLLAALTFCFSWGVFALPRDLLRWSAIPLSLLPAALIKAPDAEASSPRVVTARVAS